MKQCAKATIYLLMMVAIAEPAIANRCEVYVRRSVKVSGDLVRLCDIAVVRCDATDIVAQIEGVEVGLFSVDTNSMTFGSYEITKALERAGVAIGSVDIFGSSSCCVRRAKGTDSNGTGDAGSGASVGNDIGKLIDGIVSEIGSGEERFGSDSDEIVSRTIADELTSYAAKTAERDISRIKVQWRCRNKAVLNLAAKRLLEIKPVYVTGFGLGQVRYKISFGDSEDAKAVAKGETQAKEGNCVDVFGKVSYLSRSVVASRSIDIGQRISESDVRVFPRWVTSLREVGFEDLIEVVGQEASRNISAGQVIASGMVRKIQLVDRKSMVDIRSGSGSVQITFRGEALNGGGYGDLISLRNPANDMIVQGRIVGPGKVRIGRIQDYSNGIARKGEALPGWQWER